MKQHPKIQKYLQSSKKICTFESTKFLNNKSYNVKSLVLLENASNKRAKETTNMRRLEKV
jgi:hypothetical protein